jgi:hypothetical protein
MTRQQRPQPKDDPHGASLISRDAAQQVIVTTITIDAAARPRADELDAEAAYYRRRAIQEQQALGPGYYVDLLQAMATDRTAMAQRIRTGKDATPSAPPIRLSMPSPIHLSSTHRHDRGKRQISDDSN